VTVTAEMSRAGFLVNVDWLVTSTVRRRQILQSYSFVFAQSLCWNYPAAVTTRQQKTKQCTDTSGLRLYWNLSLAAAYCPVSVNVSRSVKHATRLFVRRRSITVYVRRCVNDSTD
jgi:hypothetical protein